MSNELGILSSDLRIYFRGFEVALGKKDVGEAVRYLKEMRREVDENLEFLVCRITDPPINYFCQNKLYESRDNVYR